MIDLHSHSTCSDGLDSPTELVAKAIDKNLKALALTDHDTLDGLEEAEQASFGSSLRLIRGVELEIIYPKGEFHLLGLNLKGNCLALEQRLQIAQQKRHDRNLIMVEKMNALGIEGTYEEIAQWGKQVIGRPHFAQHLIKLKKVKTMQQAFDRYLGYGRPLYCPKEGIELEEAVALIHQARGKAVVAHPLSLYVSWGKLGNHLKELKERGVEGLEAYHSAFRPVEEQRLVGLAKELGFFVTGGSDYHGAKHPDRKLGYSGSGPIEDGLLEALMR